jgi:Holliday junction resolvase RusA-like endonuclease
MNSIHKAIMYGPAGVQGSTCSFPHPITGKIVTINASQGEGKGRSWRQELIQEMNNDLPNAPYDEAVKMRVRIYVHRPAAHFGKNGLKPNAPRYAKSGRDGDKVQRSIGDAAQIARWVTNDSRIAGWDILRVYTTEELEPERVEIAMWSLEQYGEDFFDRIQAHVKHLKFIADIVKNG